MDWTDAKNRERLAALLASGMSHAQAAREMGCTKGQVAGATSTWGIGREPYDRDGPRQKPAAARSWDERRLTTRRASR